MYDLLDFKTSRACKNRLFRLFQTPRFMECSHHPILDTSYLSSWWLRSSRLSRHFDSCTTAKAPFPSLTIVVPGPRLIANFRLKFASIFVRNAFRRCVDGERWRETEHWTEILLTVNNKTRAAAAISEADEINVFCLSKMWGLVPERTATTDKNSRWYRIGRNRISLHVPLLSDKYCTEWRCKRAKDFWIESTYCESRFS